MTTPPGPSSSTPARPHAVRIGRGPAAWIARVALIAVGALALGAVTMLVTAGELGPGFWILAAVIVFGFGGAALGIGLATRSTWIDAQAGEVSIKGGPWVPVTQLAYARTGYYQGSKSLTLGLDAKRFFTVGDAAILGQDRATLQLVHSMVVASGLPDNADPRSRGESKAETLAWIADWSR